jgi:hypothetical protein
MSSCVYREFNYTVIITVKCKTRVIPVIIGAIGTISKALRKYVSTIPGNHEVRNYRKLPYRALHTYCGKC